MRRPRGSCDESPQFLRGRQAWFEEVRKTAPRHKHVFAGVKFYVVGRAGEYFAVVGSEPVRTKGGKLARVFLTHLAAWKAARKAVRDRKPGEHCAYCGAPMERRGGEDVTPESEDYAELKRRREREFQAQLERIRTVGPGRLYDEDE